MMEREVGSRDFPIWLLGDSNPEQWQKSLLTPLDPRHPVRHNIWTSILDIAQDRVFRAGRLRVETRSLYIRNAVDNPRLKPNSTSVQWEQATELEIAALQKLVQTHVPKLVLSFGAFSFEFARRVLTQEPKYSYGYWGAKRLGDAFRQQISLFDPKFTNVFPLLHRSVSGGKFIQSHDYFCGQEGADYFKFVGESIAGILLQHRNDLPIWIESAG